MTQINTGNIKDELDRIERRYNPECDLAPGDPIVTNTDIRLVDICRTMALMLDVLQERIEELENEQEAQE